MYKPIFNLNIGSKLLITWMRFLMWIHMLVYHSNIKLVTPKYAQHKKKFETTFDMYQVLENWFVKLILFLKGWSWNVILED